MELFRRKKVGENEQKSIRVYSFFDLMDNCEVIAKGLESRYNIFGIAPGELLPILSNVTLIKDNINAFNYEKIADQIDAYNELIKLQERLPDGLIKIDHDHELINVVKRFKSGKLFLKSRRGQQKRLAVALLTYLQDKTSSRRQAEYITGFIFERLGLINTYDSSDQSYRLAIVNMLK